MDASGRPTTASPRSLSEEPETAGAAVPRAPHPRPPAWALHELGDGDPGVCRIVAWRDGTLERSEDPAALPALLADPETRLWIDLIRPSPRRVAEVAEHLGLHPLVAEDIAERNQRAKVEDIEGVLHLVVFALGYAGEVVTHEVDIVVDRRTILTAHDATWDPDDLPQLRLGPGPLLERGTDFLLYALLDGIVDGYFPVLDRLADEVDTLQDEIIEHATSWTLQRLFTLKRELIDLRRATSPAREILNQLTNRRLALIAPDHLVYFRDVYDHLIRVTDELDSHRDQVSGTMEVYLSVVNNELSTIMKRLTGVTVVLAGMGALAGIFGMSEAATAVATGGSPGFWAITGVIVVLAALTLVLLRRIDWI